MVKVAIASDLHTEFGIPSLNTIPADVLVLAGDISVASSWNSNIRKFFQEVAWEYEHILYIMGNHEYYGSQYDKVLSFYTNELSGFSNIHVLENNSIFIKGIRFLCATLWTSCNEYDRKIVNHVDKSLNDFSLIKVNPVSRFTASDSVSLHYESLQWLQDQLRVEVPTVIVTHHCPSLKSTPDRFKGDPTNYAFSSNLDEMIEKMPHIKMWIHGHTHDKFDYMIGSTNVVCNPRGYYRYETFQVRFDPKIKEV